MKYILPVLFLFFIHTLTKGQNYLEMPVTIQSANTPIATVFDQLEAQLAFNFSYEAQLINEDNEVSINAVNKSLQDVLTLTLGHDYDFKVVGTHVIIQSNLEPVDRRGGSFSLMGQILGPDNQPLENAIVYEANRQTAAVTNYDGFYRFNFRDKNHPVALNISHSGFRDTVVHVSQGELQKMRVIPISEQRIIPSDFKTMESKSGTSLVNNEMKSLSDIKLVQFMIPDDALYVSSNLNAFNWQSAQVSLVPYVSTNDLMNGLTTNNVSFNVIGGYTAQIEGAEFGAVSNFIQNSVYGFQAAGVSNIVGKEVVGFQAAGVVNITLGDVKGGQASGVINHVKGYHTGAMVAGVINITEGTGEGSSSKGIKAQVSGVSNIHLKDTANLQITSVWNQAERVKGVQVSGFGNYTKKLNGVQIGIVNIADTIETGVPIGLINVVKSGYRKLELSTNEVFQANVAFKTGGNHLYSFLNAGFGKYIGVGYGFGYTTDYSRKSSFNIDVGTTALFDTDAAINSYMGISNRITVGLTHQISKLFAFSTGPAFNFFMVHKEAGTSLPSEINKPSGIYYGNYYLEQALKAKKNNHWFGWYFSIRF